MKSLILFSFMILNFSNVFAQQDSVITMKSMLGFEIISFVQLISNPKLYHHKKIQVSGYLHYRFEDAALYMSKTDADYMQSENAVWVAFDSKSSLEPLEKVPNVSVPYFDSKYVTIKGVFDCEDNGHMGMFIGSIKKIERMFENRRWYDGNRELSEDKSDGTDCKENK